jgi:hypothetical protein
MRLRNECACPPLKITDPKLLEEARFFVLRSFAILPAENDFRLSAPDTMRQYRRGLFDLAIERPLRFCFTKVRSSLHVYFLEAETGEQGAYIAAGVLARLVQNAAGQGCLRDLLLGRLPHLRLQVRVGRYQQSGRP